ncbi:MAG: polynucleotide adenylyltransferase PcnB [bacterium]|nr:polynucleotide adenylyltransferase PcnB [bacterium]
MTFSVTDCASRQLTRAKIDPTALYVLRHLYEAGHTAYLVGGCVRDMLLDRTPKDFDVATSARPAQVRHLFRNSRVVGRRFRLVHVYSGTKIIEVSTFRRAPDPELTAYLCEDEFVTEDGIVLDNTFGTSQEDARRRDFTINGLFYECFSRNVIDYVGGLEDIEKRLIRTIGDPCRRFVEDPVRMLRAVKFCVKLGFTMEESTWQALLKNHACIKMASLPRLQEELMRMLEIGHSSEMIQLLLTSGLLADLVPNITKYLQHSYGEGGFYGHRGKMFKRLLDLSDTMKLGQTYARSCRFTALLLPMFINGWQTHRNDEEDWICRLVEPLAACFGLSRQMQDEVQEYFAYLRCMLGSGGEQALKARKLHNLATFTYAFMFFGLLYQVGAVEEERFLYWQDWYEEKRKSLRQSKVM